MRKFYELLGDRVGVLITRISIWGTPKQIKTCQKKCPKLQKRGVPFHMMEGQVG